MIRLPEAAAGSSKEQRVGGGLQETGPEHPDPTLSLQAHGLQQLSVISPQKASSPFPSNQVAWKLSGPRAS